MMAEREPVAVPRGCVSLVLALLETLEWRRFPIWPTAIWRIPAKWPRPSGPSPLGINLASSGLALPILRTEQ